MSEKYRLEKEKRVKSYDYNPDGTRWVIVHEPVIKGTPEDILEWCLKKLKDQGRLRMVAEWRTKKDCANSTVMFRNIIGEASTCLILDPPEEGDCIDKAIEHYKATVDRPEDIE